MSVERVTALFRGDTDAVALLNTVRSISHVWDDLIDQEHPVSAGRVHKAFWQAIVELQRNPFYRAHQDELLPVLECGILNYVASCCLERTPGHPRQLAHTARYQAGDVALVIARIVGGLEWAMTVGPELKLLVHTEGFEAFDKEMEVRYAQDASAA